MAKGAQATPSRAAPSPAPPRSRFAGRGTGSSSRSSARSAPPATSSTSPSTRRSSLFDVHYLLAAVCSFLVAVTNNYLWNRVWTFRHQRGHLVFQGFRFLLVSTVALAANLVFLSVLVALGVPKLPAQAIAIALVTPWNFVANKLWSFRRRRSG